MRTTERRLAAIEARIATWHAVRAARRDPDALTREMRISLVREVAGQDERPRRRDHTHAELQIIADIEAEVRRHREVLGLDPSG